MPFYRKKKRVGDRDHLDLVPILLKGAETWNDWRAAHPEQRYVGLAGAKLRKADLAGADLSGATLLEADLFRADLSNANLFMADLTEADLRYARLDNANMDLAKCLRAYMNEASLCRADLSHADFGSATLRGAIFSEARFEADRRPTFHYADLEKADMTGLTLAGVSLFMANLTGAKLAGTGLAGASLSGANLNQADLRGADLRGAQLDSASLIDTDFSGADLTGCRVYGISAWNLRVEGAQQQGLVITPREEPVITVDNIALAQFIYLLLNNANLRHIIDTITAKVVLILGRFTEPRKAVLDAIRTELQQRDYTPVIFDFQKPAARDLTETVATLAGMARFVIADITDAKSIPQELMAIVPQFPSVPVLPIILEAQAEYAMFEHLKRYPWVLPVHRYQDQGDIEAIVRAALAAGEAYRSGIDGMAKPSADATSPEA